MSLLFGAAFGVVGVSLLACAVRILRGPTAFDRALAFDCLALDVVAAVVLWSMVADTGAYLDVVLVIALLGFLSTLSVTAWLEGRLDG